MPRNIFLLPFLVLSTVAGATTPRDTFTPIPDLDWAPPQWEVRATVIPLFSRPFQIRDRVATTREDNDFFTPPFRDYLLNDGQVISLARQPIVNSSNGGRFGSSSFSVPFSSIELVNHRPRGMRYSIGLSYYQERGALPSEFPDLDPLVDENNFIRIEGGDERTLFGFLGAQYTFHRRRRLRFHLGLTLLFLLSEKYSTETVLYGGESPEIHPVSSIVTQNNNAFGVIMPIPQVTVEYAITNQWNVSLGVGGTSGLGLGYRFKN